MTDKARKVLADCVIALELLESERDIGRWRVHWAGAPPLGRADGGTSDLSYRSLFERVLRQVAEWDGEWLVLLGWRPGAVLKRRYERMRKSWANLAQIIRHRRVAPGMGERLDLLMQAVPGKPFAGGDPLAKYSH